MSATTDQIRDLLQRALDQETLANQLLTIIANRNIDPSLVGEWAVFHFNDSWMSKINDALQEGFVVIRIQTEFQLNGHETMVYMAKMKTVPAPNAPTE